MQLNWKDTAVWGAGGAVVGGIAAAVLNSAQADTATSWATTIGVVATGIVAAVGAFIAAMRKRSS